MLRRLSKTAKIAILGTGAIAFATLAVHMKSKNTQLNSVNSDKLHQKLMQNQQAKFNQQSQLQSMPEVPKSETSAKDGQLQASQSDTNNIQIQTHTQSQIQGQTQIKPQQSNHIEGDISKFNQQEKTIQAVLPSTQTPNNPQQNQPDRQIHTYIKQQKTNPSQIQTSSQLNKQEQISQDITTSTAGLQSPQPQTSNMLQQTGLPKLDEPKTQPLQSPLPPVQNSKQAKKQNRKAVVYKKIADIPEFNIHQKIDPDDYIVIVADLPYNQTFENQIITKLTNSIKRRQSSKPLQVYRLKINQKNIRQIFMNKYGTSVKEQTILLLKNPYQDKFVNIDFDMYVQHINVPSIYLSQLRIPNTKQQLKRYLKKMTPNDTYLLLVVDTQNDPDLARRKLTAKYIEMEMGVYKVQNIKVLIVDEKMAKEDGIISNDTKPNSLHLIRKSNQFTFKAPNRTLYNGIPYHVIQNISLYDKQKNLMIPRYLSKVQTFNSMNIDAPFVCSITIDRNRISPKEQRQILKVFSQIKQSKQFPHVSFILKFGETEYRGAKQDKFSNKKWIVKVANLQQIDKQLLMHQIKQFNDAQMLKIDEKSWQKNSYQFLYRQPEITAESLKEFIYRSVSGQQKQFYKSEAKFKLQHTQNISSQSFQEKIFKDNNSHLVFQYSDHCQTCQVLSPIIDYFSDVCQKFPELKIKVHALNCDKNKVKGQPYSPYTPNLYYYSKKWKNRDPIKYNIVQNINHTNVWGIYDFCNITDSLGQVNIAKFEQNIKNFMNSKVNLTDF